MGKAHSRFLLTDNEEIRLESNIRNKILPSKGEGTNNATTSIKGNI